VHGSQEVCGEHHKPCVREFDDPCEHIICKRCGVSASGGVSYILDVKEERVIVESLCREWTLRHFDVADTIAQRGRSCERIQSVIQHEFERLSGREESNLDNSFFHSLLVTGLDGSRLAIERDERGFVTHASRGGVVVTEAVRRSSREPSSVGN
jgi:hypothetical protein